jgi:hypothetical protein
MSQAMPVRRSTGYLEMGAFLVVEMDQCKARLKFEIAWSRIPSRNACPPNDAPGAFGGASRPCQLKIGGRRSRRDHLQDFRQCRGYQTLSEHIQTFLSQILIFNNGMYCCLGLFIAIDLLQ